MFAFIQVLSLESGMLSQSLYDDEEQKICSFARPHTNRQLDMCLPSVSIPGSTFSMT